MTLSKDAILGAHDIVTETVDVPEWGDKVHVRGLTGEELDAYQSAIRQYRPRADGKPGMELVVTQINTHANLLVKCLVDAEGNRLFLDGDAGALGAKSGRILERLFAVASRLSGLDEDEEEAIEGNSGAAPSGVSTTSSPETSSTAP